jgi:hypothetical protein
MKSMGYNCIDLFAPERQKIAENIFELYSESVIIRLYSSFII